ncbi:unnamed protein product [Tetraodon nigroviridis]|uniref:Chromosome 11 SCAF14979, whole genome shotgun sequence n=1 Tax=Tetraodon nigroviridis TaxID=99883 RepID=Q4RXG5_TETNG|nr:unnamed protein product [Tetraodon nigroviridis]
MSGIPPDTWQPKTVAVETTMGTIVVDAVLAACTEDLHQLRRTCQKRIL